MPHWRHLWHDPRALVEGAEPDPARPGLFRVRVRVEGLVCGLCAARAQAGLARLPGVLSVRFDPTRDAFDLLTAQPPDAGAVDRAVRSRVILPGLRRWLDRWRRRRAGG